VTAALADAFYWIALIDFNDRAHGRAAALTSDLADVAIVTTDEVLTECLTFFATASVALRRKAVASVRRILENPGVRVLPQNRESFFSGLDLYEARPDKEYSLVDCISMQTMRKEQITDVLTNDRHFEQEGFRALFRES
jgi:predicted nucleic acid-binding protein